MMKAPRRGLASPPRVELSGSAPSHEPQTRSVNPSEKATRTQRATAEAAKTTTAKPEVFVEGMQKELSADASDGALLQRRMPEEGGVVTMEKPAAVAAVGEGSQEAAATKHSPTRTAATGGTCALTAERAARGSSQGASTKLFLGTPAIVPAAMNAFNERGDRHYSDSARPTASGH